MWKLKLYQWLLLVTLWGAGVVIAIKYEVDFPVFYRAIQVSASSPVHAYSADLMYQNGPRFYYGPLTLVIARPLAWFNFKSAKYFWVFLQTIAFVVFWNFLLKHFDVLRKNQVAWLLVFASSINPIHLNFQSNNIQMMILAFLMVAESLSTKPSTGKQILAGLIIPFLGCIKVFPWFVIVYYFLGKSWAVRWGLVIGMMLSFALPLLVFGWNDGLATYQVFYSSLGKYQQHNSFIESTNLQCLHSLVASLLPDRIVEGPWFPLLANSLFVSIGSLFFFYVWKSGKKIANPIFQNALWTLTIGLMVFINPSSLGHYLVFLVPGVAAGFELLDRLPNSVCEKILMWGGALIIMVVVDGMIGRTASHALQKIRIPAMGMLILCAGLFLSVYRFGKMESHAIKN